MFSCKLVHKINNKWIKWRLRPIRVFVFHQVSDVYDASTMWRCDWTQTEHFKELISSLQARYQFISLSEAYDKLLHDFYRREDFAVLTSDDGWLSVRSILPWLDSQKIPITLFLNPAYMMQNEVREHGMDKLLTASMVRDIVATYDNVTIASHGWNHGNCVVQNRELFGKNVRLSNEYLRLYDSFIPFFAYPCGYHTVWQDLYLHSSDLIPVYCDGMCNYHVSSGIHRECIDGKIDIE